MKLRQLKPSQRYRKSLSKERRRAIWQQAHGKCWYCGGKTGKKEFVLDHQDPFSRGGADSKRNLVVACAGCDREKGSLGVDEYRALKRRELGEPDFLFYGEQAGGSPRPA